MVEHKIEQMLQTMAGKGLRITEQRRTMARLFAEATGYLTAKEVYEGLESKHSGLSFDTVYRNLRVLDDLGVVEQFHFEDGIKFRVGCFTNNHNHHHHHLICLSCDHIYPLEFCPIPYVADANKPIWRSKLDGDNPGICSFRFFGKWKNNIVNKPAEVFFAAKQKASSHHE